MTRNGTKGNDPVRGWGALVGLARACHPGPTVAVTALTSALAVVAGQSAAGCVCVAGAALTGQLSVGWCNDAVDAARDTAAGRTGKPIVARAVTARSVRAAAVVALVLCAPLSLLSGVLAAAVHLTAVAGAWAYDLGLKATTVSWLPYAVGFGALPAFVTLGLPGHPWPAWWAVSAAALLGCGAHLANVLPDIAVDLATGVRGRPQRLGARRVRLLIPVPLLAASVLLLLSPPGPPDAASWTVSAVATLFAAAGLAFAGRSPRLPFVTAIAVATADVVLLLIHGTVITAR